jgi:hypothetical protein
MLIQGLNVGTGQVQDIRVTSNGAACISAAGSNDQVYDGSAAWANSAAQNTNVDKDIALPTDLQTNAMYLITIINPSTVTALTIVVKNTLICRILGKSLSIIPGMSAKERSADRRR